MTDIVWQSMPLAPAELSLARVLRCGQAFRWKNVNNVWSFAAQDQIVLLQQDATCLRYASVLPAIKREDAPPPRPAAHFVADYFNLNVRLADLYASWAAVAARHSRPQGTASFGSFPGIRMLRQEPWETVVLFICSSNNNVKRILKMCDALCAEYGAYLNEHGGVRYHAFPGPAVLAQDGVEARLRELGFGYRARYIHQTARMFVDPARPDVSLDALYALRHAPYEDAHAFLLQLSGVGPKVADCICLMALDKHDVVPVDTHVLQIAVRDYSFRGAKTMGPKAYHQVRGHLRLLFGEYAGWAQLVMFAADLSDLNNGVNQVDGAAVRHEIVLAAAAAAAAPPASHTLAVKSENAEVVPRPGEKEPQVDASLGRAGKRPGTLRQASKRARTAA